MGTSQISAKDLYIAQLASDYRELYVLITDYSAETIGGAWPVEGKVYELDTGVSRATLRMDVVDRNNSPPFVRELNVKEKRGRFVGDLESLFLSTSDNERGTPLGEFVVCVSGVGNMGLTGNARRYISGEITEKEYWMNMSFKNINEP